MAKKLRRRIKPVWLMILAAAGLGLIVAAAILQIRFNKNVQQQLNWLNAQQFSSIIKDSMDQLNDLKTELPADGTLEELQLALPPADESMGRVLYRHFDGADSMPAEVEITSQALIDLGRNKLNGLTHEEIINGHSEASACSRAFVLRLQQAEGETATVTKQLRDGRTLYITRETKCGQGGITKPDSASSYTDADMRHNTMNEFQAYLLKAESL